MSIDGAGGTFDKSQQRPYTENPLSPTDLSNIDSRMLKTIHLAVNQLRYNRDVLGSRFAIGIQPVRNLPEALLLTGALIDASYRKFSAARTPNDLEREGCYPVRDFNPTEIDRVSQTIEGDKQANPFNRNDTHYIGFIEVGEKGYELGVVDRQGHTITRLVYARPGVPPTSQ